MTGEAVQNMQSMLRLSPLSCLRRWGGEPVMWGGEASPRAEYAHASDMEWQPPEILRSHAPHHPTPSLQNDRGSGPEHGINVASLPSVMLEALGRGAGDVG